MTPESCACQSLCINAPANSIEQDKLSGQGSAKRSNVGSDKAPTKVFISPEALISPFIFPSTENLFTRFMKVFMETTHAQALAELQECPFKARTLDTYFRTSYMDCYYFCQQSEDYLKISGATEMNHTSFTTTFVRGIVSLK